MTSSTPPPRAEPGAPRNGSAATVRPTACHSSPDPASPASERPSAAGAEHRLLGTPQHSAHGGGAQPQGELELSLDVPPRARWSGAFVDGALEAAYREERLRPSLLSALHRTGCALLALAALTLGWRLGAQPRLDAPAAYLPAGVGGLALCTLAVARLAAHRRWSWRALERALLCALLCACVGAQAPEPLGSARAREQEEAGARELLLDDGALSAMRFALAVLAAGLLTPLRPPLFALVGAAACAAAVCAAEGVVLRADHAARPQRARGARAATHALLVLLVCAARAKDLAADQALWFLRRTVRQKLTGRERARLKRARAQAAQRARSHLLRAVMHDLRSPLVSVHALATRVGHALPQGLQLGSAPVQTCVRAIRDAALRMERTMEAMLDFERIEAGALGLQLGAVRLDALVEKAVEECAAEAAAAGVALSATPAPAELRGARFEGDARRLQQCVAIGLSNALRHCGGAEEAGGAVSVSLARCEGGAEAGWARVRVCVGDSGRGLSGAELAALSRAELFATVGRGQLGGRGGAGLGLPLAARVLALHGGSELRLRSQGLGRGASFELLLRLRELPRDGGDGGGAGGDGAHRPRAHEPAPPRWSSRAPHGARPAAAVRALHVDDDAFVRLAVPPVTLGALGIAHDEAEDGAAALALVRQRGLDAYCAVLLDNQMPNMTGARAARELRALGYAGLLIGLTGDPAGCEDRRAFEAAGVDAVLDKSSDGLAAVSAALRALLEHGEDAARALLRELAPRAPQPPSRQHSHSAARADAGADGADADAAGGGEPGGGGAAGGEAHRRVSVDIRRDECG